MNAWKSIELMRKYAKCEKCGSEKVGNGEGTLEITDDTFVRTCKCGWKVEIKEE
jgi:hypothetical protein